MNIDDFIWLPDIVDKLAVKHHVTQDEVEEISSTTPSIALPNPGIILVKTFMPHSGKQMQAATWPCSSFASREIEH